MAAARFHCSVRLTVGHELPLPDAVARHAVRVLRLRVGDMLTLFDGNGGEYAARLVRDRDPATVRIEGYDPVDRESPLPITLVQGVASAERMDFVVQKAIELGVAAIEPVVAARSVPRFDREKALRRQAHWQQVVVSASEQCGRNRIAPVALPMALDDWLRADREDGLRLMLSTRAEAPLRQMQVDGAPVTLLVGPEGGFTDEELLRAQRRGFAPVALGPRTLRTETAALAALAVLQAKAGDLG